MKIIPEYSLKNHNTFGLDVKAQSFIEVNSKEELCDFLRNSPIKEKLKLVLGGGSNLLLTQNIKGVVLHLNIKGLTAIEENNESVLVGAKAGENWHEFVLWAIKLDLGGIENLSLIPGNVGTAPMQNIGAYGVEIKDVFHSLDAIEIKSGKKRTFTKDQCNFGYRESIFKVELRNQYIITTVRFLLRKAPHKLSTHYGAIQSELEEREIVNPGIKEVSDVVIAIRQSKLPDPKEIGNSGSFFKNPIIPEQLAKQLKSEFSEMPIYPTSPGNCKVAAGWLIEKAGWKGYRKGDAGVHKKQALVLVNYGKASGAELLSLSKKIIDSVQDKFGIELIPEVNII